MKLKKAREDIFVFAFLIAVSLWLLLYALPTQVAVPQGVLQGGSFTPRTLPLLVVSAMLVCCVLGLAGSVLTYWKLRRAGEALEKNRKWSEMSRREKLAEFMPLFAFLLCVLYYLLFSYAGFLVATIVVPPLALLAMGDFNWRHYLYVYGFCAVMYLVFTFVLKVHLP